MLRCLSLPTSPPSSTTLVFMALACNEPQLEQLLRDVAFTREFGFTLHSIADGQCTIDVPFRAAFERPGGIVSGQVFMAAADVAMACNQNQAGHRRRFRDSGDGDEFSRQCQEKEFSVCSARAHAWSTTDLRVRRMPG